MLLRRYGCPRSFPAATVDRNTRPAPAGRREERVPAGCRDPPGRRGNRTARHRRTAMGRNRRREERMLAAADRLNPEVPPPAPRRWPLLIAVIGDGSFQLTVQELANMIRHGQETVIFLVNNRGYVSESIHD